MDELLNEFESLAIANDSVQSLIQQFQNIDLGNPDESEITQLENMFVNLNLQNNEKITRKFFEFIMILRKKNPCRVYTDFTISKQTRCH